MSRLPKMVWRNGATCARAAAFIPDGCDEGAGCCPRTSALLLRQATTDLDFARLLAAARLGTGGLSKQFGNCEVNIRTSAGNLLSEALRLDGLFARILRNDVLMDCKMS